MSNSKSDNLSNIKARTLFLIGTVDEEALEDVLRGMQQLEAKSHDDIVVYLSTGGGEVDSGLAIFDAFITSPCKIICVAYGSCQSMGAVIMQGADVRLLSPHTTYMVHDGSIASGRVHTKEFFENAKYYERQALTIDNIFVQRTGLSLEKIQEMCKFSTSMNSNEAVKLGFADGILIRDPSAHKKLKKKRKK